MKKTHFPLLIGLLLVFLFPVVAIADDHVFEQYLLDVDCANKAITDDGTNLQTNPENHNVTCLKMTYCSASGYGLIIRNKKTGRYNFFKFDEKGDELARKLLETTNKTDNMRVKVRGTIDKRMIIKVNNIEEY